MKKIYPLGSKIEQLIRETDDDYFEDVPREDDKEYKTQAPLADLPKGGFGYPTRGSAYEDINIKPVVVPTKKKKKFIEELPPKDNFVEEPEVKFENKKLKEQKNPKDNEQVLGQSPAVPGPYSQDINAGEDPNAMGGAVDPNAAGGMYQDPSMGGDPNAMGGMGTPPPKTPEEIGRIFELKKIYARLISIEEYLSFSPNVTLVSLRDYVSKAIELFETLISNVDTFKDQLDEIIVMFYKFLEYVYDVMNKYYKDKAKEDKNDVNKSKLFTTPEVTFRKK